MNVRVLVADDHAPTRRDVVATLEREPDFVVCAEAATAAEAVAGAVRELPDVCLLDIHMPGSGVAAAWEIRARLPQARILFLTVSDDDRDLFPALRAGAAGYLLKDMDLRDLPAALRSAVAGGGVLPDPLTARVLIELRGERPRRDSVPRAGGATFTSREWDVLELLQLGLTTSQIARRLTLTPATIRSHVASITRKVGAGSRSEALALLERPQALR